MRPILLVSLLAFGLAAAPAQAAAESLLDLLDSGPAATPPKKAYRPKPRPKPRPRPPAPLVSALTVDCGAPGLTATPLNDALDRLLPGGLLYIRSGGAPCRESLYIDRPVVIVGEGTPLFAPGPALPPTIAPPAGAPCLHIAPRITVEVRDITLDASRAERSACIEAEDARVGLVRATVRYAGEASAIYLLGGRLETVESDIDAASYDAAVTIDGGGVRMLRTRIRAETIGLDIAPLAGTGDNRLEQVGVLAVSARGRPGDLGVVVRSLRQDAAGLTVHDSVVCGFKTGVLATRDSQTQVQRSRICRARNGVSASQAVVSVSESVVAATDRGIYADGGQVSLLRNRIVGAATPVQLDPPTQRTVEGNGAFMADTQACLAYDGAYDLFCAQPGYAPPQLLDETDFDQSARPGWMLDGYGRGYMRDGPPAPWAPPPPVRPRGIFGR